MPASETMANTETHRNLPAASKLLNRQKAEKALENLVNLKKKIVAASEDSKLSQQYPLYVLLRGGEDSIAKENKLYPLFATGEYTTAKVNKLLLTIDWMIKHLKELEGLRIKKIDLTNQQMKEYFLLIEAFSDLSDKEITEFPELGIEDLNSTLAHLSKLGGILSFLVAVSILLAGSVSSVFLCLSLGIVTVVPLLAAGLVVSTLFSLAMLTGIVLWSIGKGLGDAFKTDVLEFNASWELIESISPSSTTNSRHQRPFGYHQGPFPMPPRGCKGTFFRAVNHVKKLVATSIPPAEGDYPTVATSQL